MWKSLYSSFLIFYSPILFCARPRTRNTHTHTFRCWGANALKHMNLCLHPAYWSTRSSHASQRNTHTHTHTSSRAFEADGVRAPDEAGRWMGLSGGRIQRGYRLAPDQSQLRLGVVALKASLGCREVALKRCGVKKKTKKKVLFFFLWFPPVELGSLWGCLCLLYGRNVDSNEFSVKGWRGRRKLGKGFGKPRGLYIRVAWRSFEHLSLLRKHIKSKQVQKSSNLKVP